MGKLLSDVLFIIAEKAIFVKQQENL